MSQSVYVCGRQIAPESLAERITRALGRRFGAKGVVGGERPDPAALAASDLVVALIDRGWTRGPDGVGWLDDPADLTRAALIAAAQEGKAILPLLLDGAAMPEVEDLPDELRFLHFRNARVVGAGDTFDADMARVVGTLEAMRRGRGFYTQVGAFTLAAAAWVTVVLIVQLLDAFTTLGHLGVVGDLFRSVRETNVIAFAPVALVALYAGVRTLLMRRWRFAVILLACAALLAEEMSRAITVSGFAPPWSAMPWAVALASRSALVPLYVVALAALFFLALRGDRVRYSHMLVTAQQRFRDEEEAKRAGVTRDIFVCCRPADMSATYHNLCAVVARYLTQNPRENRPLRQPAPDGYTGDGWVEALANSPDALVFIGPHWGDGLRDPNDPIRRQLAEALRTGKELVPVLIDGARTPALADVPPELAPLCFGRPILVRPTHHWYNNLIDDGYNLVVSRLLGVPGTYSGLLTFLVDATFFNFSPDVFLSYRRADSAVMCRRIYQALSRWSRLGQRVFRDTNAISAGVDFYSTLLGAIASSEVVVAIIGPRWLSLVGPTGARRLDDPEDMVRREVETALDSEKTIIPVLLDDTPMPTVAQLPERLAPLASLTPLRMRSGPGFAQDSARLAAEVRRRLGIESHPALAALSALAAVAAGGALSLWQTRSDGIAYLFQQHPAWCYQTPVALCFGNRPDPRVITALGWLLTVGLGGLAVALLAAFWLMTRRRQFVWLFVLGVYTLLLGVFAAVVAAIFAGRLPATVPLGVFNGASYSSSTIYAFVTVLLEVAIVGALGLAWYFWRSRGRPRDLPAAV